MRRRRIWTGFGAIAVTTVTWLLWARPAPVSGESAPGPERVMAFDVEPVLFFDVSGFGFGGPLHQKLSVYSNGLVSMSDMIIAGDGRAAFKNVPVSAVQRLRHELFAAGAHTLQDNPQMIADSPLKTVTFFRDPAPQARANTFNYELASGPWGTVTTVINDFIAEHFPEFAP